MKAWMWNLWFYGLWWASVLANGFFFYQMCRPFAQIRSGRFWHALLFLTFAGNSGMVIWIGDPNMLYTMPVYFFLFLVCTQGDVTGRLAVGIVFFCLEMSVCALLDTYVPELESYRLYDLLVRLLRTAIFGALWLLLRRRFPAEPVCLSRRLWQMVLGLAAMPLCALVAVVLLTFQKYDSAAVYTLAMNQGLVVLPFAGLTSLVILFAVLLLADHERLEQLNRLAGVREIYYQGLQQQAQQVRQIRHDLRNHLTVVQGCLERGDTQGALCYLEQIAGSSALRGNKRFCDNETANAVLCFKAVAMQQLGIVADFAVSLPTNVPVADIDLAALLGNALDNAMESVQNAEKKKVKLRCCVNKGMLMLRMENAVGGKINPDLFTTKADKLSHGFGLPGMREIARRYHGTLEAGVEDGQFILIVCLMV